MDHVDLLWGWWVLIAPTRSSNTGRIRIVLVGGSCPHRSYEEFQPHVSPPGVLGGPVLIAPTRSSNLLPRTTSPPRARVLIAPTRSSNRAAVPI